ncbi:MAG: hypothetical protein NTY33_03040 [Candidatus Moranbacteria bacterium]|nr:hypothetical protein [Candidatus Moranbacteria bacterium]
MKSNIKLALIIIFLVVFAFKAGNVFAWCGDLCSCGPMHQNCSGCGAGETCDGDIVFIFNGGYGSCTDGCPYGCHNCSYGGGGGCSPDCSSNYLYCSGTTFGDGCGGTCAGTGYCPALSISGSCNSNGTISLNWIGGPSSAYYLLRIDETSNNGQPGMIDGWYRSNPPDLIDNYVQSRSYSYSGIPGKNYNAWVHPSANINIVASTSFTCPIILPTCGVAFTESQANSASITTACLGATKGFWSNLVNYNRTQYDLWGKCQKLNGAVSWKLDENSFSNAGWSGQPWIFNYAGEEKCQVGIFNEGVIPSGDWSNKLGSCSTGAVSVTDCSAPTVSISVSPNPVPYGGNPGFTLSSTNGYYCYVLIDWTTYLLANYATSGTYYYGAFTTPGAHTASAYCYNSTWVGSGWSTTNFTVNSAPTATLSASPTAIPYSGSSTLTWSTIDATSCWADWSGWVATSGSVSTGALTANKTYNLTCYNNVGASTGTKSATVSVSVAPTCSLSVSPNPVSYGGSPSFTLSSTSAYYCHILMDGVWDWNVSGYFTSGTYSPGALTTPGAHSAWCYCYNSAWVNPNGWSITNFTVNSAPLPIITITAIPATVAYGAASTISWSVTNTTSCWASGAWSGWKSVAGGAEPTGPILISQAYNLECWNNAGVSSGVKSVTVSLNCSPSTACTEPNCGSVCGKKIDYNCTGTCGGVCTATTCPQKKTCPPCNSGTWQEIAL